MAQYLEELPQSIDMPISHAMTEFVLEMLFGDGTPEKREALAHVIRWIDEQVEHLQSPKPSRNAVKLRRSSPKCYNFDDPIIEQFQEVNLWVYKRRDIGQQGVHYFTIRVDPFFDIAEGLRYDNGGIQIDEENIPETVINGINARVYDYAAGETISPVMTSELVELEIRGTSLPDMPITRIASDNDGHWYDLDKSWEPWQALRERLITKYNITRTLMLKAKRRNQ